MGLTTSQRNAVTKTIVSRYQRAGRVEKGRFLELVPRPAGTAAMLAGLGAGAEAEDRPATRGTAAHLMHGSDCRAAVVVGGAGCADG